MKRIYYCCLGVSLLGMAGLLMGQQPGTVDLTPKALDRIAVGTVIGDAPPQGWSHLVLFAVPTLTGEDLRDAPQMAADYARMFKFTILANVAKRQGAESAPYFLERVARGFATTIKNKQTIISSANTLGARLGFFGPTILEENEKCLDNDVRQIVRTDTMQIFDAQAVMRRGNDHVNMVMRHALLVDPRDGRLYTLVWLLTKGYQTAEMSMQLLPNGMREKRMLSVKRDKFNFLGVPTRDAFALRRVPPGTPVPYTPELKQAAAIKTFDAARAARTEAVLRQAAIKIAQETKRP